MSNFFLPTCVSADLLDDANQLALVVGQSMADLQTWVATPFQRDGVRYATRDLWVPQGWIDGITGPLQRPAWDVDEQIDMDAAARAQAAILLVDASEGIQPATPGKIIVVLGADIDEALAGWGINLIEQEASE
jgi:hypothetical protein